MTDSFAIDIAALEARVVAAAMGDPTVFDPHQLRAAAHFGVAYSAVTPEQRRVGKRLNYLRLYSPQEPSRPLRRLVNLRRGEV